MLEAKRTHMMTEVTINDIGKEVVVKGWVQKKRNLGSLIFVDLRDRTGCLQIYFNPEICDENTFKLAQSLHSEYVVGIRGKLQKRGGAINKDMKTGEIEVVAEELIIYSKAETPPFHIEENSQTKEELRLKHRYLDLRRPDLQRILMFRSKAMQTIREFMYEEGFIEVETPILTKSTPEGARDYLVPSRLEHGKFYALPQSPQLFKQLLMVGGFDKYFQIAKCFRDEDLRADRQPEFTQIDMEMSFVDMEDVLEINERFLQYLVKNTVGKEIQIPFERLTYKQAMENYGSDKPDLRFDMKLCDVTDIYSSTEFDILKTGLEEDCSIRALRVPGMGGIARKKLDALDKVVKGYGIKAMLYIAMKEEETKCSFAKFTNEAEINDVIQRTESQKGDLIIILSGEDSVILPCLGAIRLQFGHELNLIDEDELKFLWVTDFPLFEYSKEEDRFVAQHHPFTMVSKEDVDTFDTDKKHARARAYDAVLNGYEISSGSVRIHDADIQARMFNALGFTKEEADERFGFLLNAFKYGVPPHAGMGYGLDRIIMILSNTDNIRDVIAFPKTKEASCLMTNAPDYVEQIQLDDLGILCKEGE